MKTTAFIIDTRETPFTDIDQTDVLLIALSVWCRMQLTPIAYRAPTNVHIDEYLRDANLMAVNEREHVTNLAVEMLEYYDKIINTLIPTGNIFDADMKFLSSKILCLNVHYLNGTRY